MKNKSLGFFLCILIIVFCSVTASSLINAEEVDAEYFGRLLFQAHQRGDWLPDIYRINPHLEESALYAIQKQYINARLKAGDTIGGYKGGFIPQAPVGGVLFGGNKIMHGASEVSLDEFTMLIVEAEIGFRFCRAIEKPISSVEELKTKICEIMPVMEIADGAIADFAEVKKNFTHLRNTLISINVASARTLVGNSHAPNIDLNEVVVSMVYNGKQIGSRDMTKTIDFWQNVLLVVNDYVVKNNFEIKPDQFVIGGNLTGIHVAERGTYQADFGPLGSLSLRVK